MFDEKRLERPRAQTIKEKTKNKKGAITVASAPERVIQLMVALLHCKFITLVLKNYFTSTAILLCNISTVILHYILVIKFHESIVKSQPFS